MKFNLGELINRQKSMPASPAKQPSVSANNQTAPVGWVSVWTIPELTNSSEQEKEEITVEPDESQPDNESWLVPAPDSDLPESGIVWYAGEDPGEPVSMEDLRSDSAFLHKRKEVLVACLRGENHFDYDGLSPLGAHCIKQLVAWMEANKDSSVDLSGVNLEGVNLSEADLRGLDLSGANLTSANLEEVELCGANLRGASLRCANLKGANLQEANMLGANLT